MDNLTVKRVLRETGFIGRAKALSLVREAAEKKLSLEELIIKTGATTEEILYREAARVLKFPFANLPALTIRKDVLFLVPEPIATSRHFIAYDKTPTEIKLATTDPGDIQTVEFIRRKTGLTPRVALATPSAIADALKAYHVSLRTEFETITGKGAIEAVSEEDLKKLAENIPVVRVVDSILEHAAYEGASDIHIEPTEKETLVRYRIDGVLRQVMTLPKLVQDGIIARVKILSNLKLDEHRLPQDGRFKIATPDFRFSIRVSVLPVFDGEKVVLRLLPETAKALTLEELGLHPTAAEAVLRAIKRPHGIVYSTGPTGSGKTTTLYSILNMLNKPGVNIVTVEDPIEYRIPGVNQSQVQPRIGYTFANGLRSILRQDPNVIMVGEIRDQETAEISANAALTGHLVLTTLHTNDAPTALPRLADLGVPGFMIAFTTNAIIAQRLVRKVCNDCAEEVRITKAELDELAELTDLKKLAARLAAYKALPKGASLERLTLRHGIGCPKCGHEGYRGRIGIYEVLELSPAMSSLVAAKADVNVIRTQAVKDGMIPMLEDGVIKAINGVTTIQEVLRVTRE